LITEIPQSLTAICNALKDHKSLVEVDFSDNAFGGRSADPLVPLLTYNRSIQIVKLNNNGLGPAGGEIVANALIKSAQISKENGEKSNLRTIICGRNRLENGSAPVFAQAFAEHGTLECVRMIQNGIRQEGVVALADGLSKCPKLRELDIQDNVADAKGCDALSKAATNWPNLTYLNLSDCVLTPAGGSKLIDSLASLTFPSKLTTLCLQNAELDDEAIHLLRVKLETGLLALKRVEIQWNDNDPDSDDISKMKDILKIRGGVVLNLSDDEEEEEEEEGAAGEEVAEKDATGVDNGADELADLMSKVEIK
jgi:Ran GTPase-activating protein 1